MSSTSLTRVPVGLNIYLGLFLYTIGVIGSIGNMIIYRSRSFRDRACSIYLFCRAMTDFFYMHFILLTRILQKGFQIAITTRSDVLCKLRQFGSNYGNQLAFTFLALATLDRILLAHPSINVRQWGNRISLAKKLVFISSIVWILILCHRLIWYSVSSKGQCEGQQGAYAYFDNLFDAIVTCIFPIVSLIILWILIGRSVRLIIQRRRILPTTNTNSAIQKIDGQLTVMLFLDLCVALISFLPYAAHLIYINVTQTWSKSPLRIAWENIFIELIRLLSYLFFVCSFYVSMISLTSFRHQLLRSIRLKKLQTVVSFRTGVVTIGDHSLE